MSNLGKLFGKFATALFIASAILFIGSGCKHESSPSPAPVQPAKPTLSSIAIATAPNNDGAFVGDALNTDGLKIIATYSNGNTKTLTADDPGVTISPTTLSKAQNTITVSYKDGSTTKSTSFSVTAQEDGVDSITIKTNPAKTEGYFVGDTLDPKGLIITATYKRGGSVDVPYSETSGITLNPTTLNTAGDNVQITVTYEGKTASFNVKVAAVELTSIVITDNPKTTYSGDETFSTAGLGVMAYYNNGTMATVTSAVTTELQKQDGTATTEFEDGQTYKLVVSYTEGSITKTATVENIRYTTDKLVLQEIAVTTTPTKTSYFVGDELDITGLVVTATYTKGGTNETHVVSIARGNVTADLTTPGTNKDVTITYTEGDTTVTTKYQITVQAIELASIEITRKPNLLEYYTEDDLDTTGIIVTAKYNNDSTKIVDEDDLVFSPEEFATAGDSIPVTVSYTEDGTTKTATFNVKVTARPVLSGITVTVDSADIAVTESSGVLSVNMNGISTTGATYQWVSDGATVSTAATYTLPTMESGDVVIVSVKVTVGGKSYSANITVKKN